VWRYFALASVIVVTVAAIVAALPSAPRPDRASTYSSSSRATPGPAQRDDAGRTPLPVSGEAPWALSALPECFREIRHASGSRSFVEARVPRDAVVLPDGVVLRSGDCRVRVSGLGIWVERGPNRLRIPAPARLYVVGRRLLLRTVDGARAELRTYVLPGRTAPAASTN